MDSVTRLNRTVPLVRFDVFKLGDELGAEYFGDLSGGQIVVVMREQERIAESGWIDGLFGLPQLIKELYSIVLEGIATSLRVQVDVREGHTIGDSKPVLVLVQKRLQLLIGRVCCVGEIFCDEFELWAKSATDDCIVLIEAHFEGLAIENLFIDVVLDEPFQLGLGRRALPGAVPHLGDVEDSGLIDDDLVLPSACRSLAPESSNDEKARGKNQKVEQGFAERASNPLHARLLVLIVIV